MPPIPQAVEDTITTMLLQPQHIWLMVGIFSLIFLLRTIAPVADFLFSPKWNWLVRVLNIFLSFIGIFVLKLTTATTLNMKIVMVVLIAAITSYGYEFSKPIIKKFFPAVFSTPESDADKETPTKPGT